MKQLQDFIMKYEIGGVGKEDLLEGHDCLRSIQSLRMSKGEDGGKELRRRHSETMVPTVDQYKQKRMFMKQKVILNFVGQEPQLRPVFT